VADKKGGVAMQQLELEQRVKSLEYEIKILKNEIQRTLLDIQEQILVHYYPSLRAMEESTPTEGIIQSIESIREKKQQSGGVSNPPAVKQVSLEDVQTAQTKTPVSPDEGVSVQPGGQDDQARVMALSGWVSGTAQKIGRERTAKLIQVCTGKGILAPDLENPLLRLTGLITGDDVPETVTVNEILSALTKLDGLLGREANVDEALSIIEEAGFG
jgi:hypothetical protein